MIVPETFVVIAPEVAERTTVCAVEVTADGAAEVAAV